MDTSVAGHPRYRLVPRPGLSGNTRSVARHVESSRAFDTLDSWPPACVLEVEDLSYSFNSAVTLPALPEPRTDDRSEAAHFLDSALADALRRHHPEVYEAITVKEHTPDVIDAAVRDRRTLCLVAITYYFLGANPSYRLVVAGHTDTSGPDAYNFPLSELRARNVVSLLTGDRARWVSICRERSTAEDVRLICADAARVRGWPCAPDESGGDLRGPVMRWQHAYNLDFGRAIAEDGVVGAETWGAIFDVYMDELATLMGTTVEGLAEHRARLKFVDDRHRYIGCGERIPIDEPWRDEFRSAENRRVDLLFFHQEAPPDLSAHLPGGVIHAGRGGREDSGVYEPATGDWVLIRPTWWKGKPSSQYNPKFEILDTDEDLSGLPDDPEHPDYEAQVVAGPARDPEDAWAFLDGLEGRERRWRHGPGGGDVDVPTPPA